MRDRAVITIGGFDGVHVGHAALLCEARRVAARLDAGVVAMGFFPSPRAVLGTGPAPALLTGWDRRRELLRSAGADEVRLLDPRGGVLAMSPERFVESLAEEWEIAAFVEGPDFRFGAKRSGDMGTLREIGRRMGFEAVVIDPVECALTDLTLVRASSSVARWMVEHGRVRDAAIVLGRPHRIEGEVVRGDQRGRELGMRTANMRSEILPPRDGVYGAVAITPDGGRVPAALSVGTKPMFDGVGRAVEAHLIGWSPSAGAPEYGWRLALDVLSFERDQMRFESVDALVAQMRRDVGRIEERCAADAQRERARA